MTRPSSSLTYGSTTHPHLGNKFLTGYPSPGDVSVDESGLGNNGGERGSWKTLSLLKEVSFVLERVTDGSSTDVMVLTGWGPVNG